MFKKIPIGKKPTYLDQVMELLAREPVFTTAEQVKEELGFLKGFLKQHNIGTYIIKGYNSKKAKVMYKLLETKPKKLDKAINTVVEMYQQPVMTTAIAIYSTENYPQNILQPLFEKYKAKEEKKVMKALERGAKKVMKKYEPVTEEQKKETVSLLANYLQKK